MCSNFRCVTVFSTVKFHLDNCLMHVLHFKQQNVEIRDFLFTLDTSKRLEVYIIIYYGAKSVSKLTWVNYRRLLLA